MAFFQPDIEKDFSAWGKAKRSVPASAGTIEQKALLTLETPTAPIKKSSWSWRIGFSAAGLAVLLILIHNYISSQTSYSSAPTLYKYPKETSTGQSARPISEEDLGISYGAAAGLSATDISATPLGRVVGAVAPLFNKDDEEVSAIDQREYLKTGYSATIETRKPTTLTLQLETIIRGHGGRIDTFSSSKKSGYISFVLPKKSLEAFRSELITLIPERFVDEYIQAENLLPQKVDIDTEMNETKKELAAQKKVKQDLTAAFQAMIASYKNKLAANTRSIQTLRTKQAATPEEAASIAANIDSLTKNNNSLQNRIGLETKKYEEELGYINDQIETLESNQTDLQNENSHLLANVETVQGTISLNWISLLEYIEKYFPYFRIALVVVIVGAIYSYLRYGRKKALPLP